MASGPLYGVKIIEIAGIGPGPFCAMLLSDMGADVVRIDRPTQAWGPSAGTPAEIAGRGRRSVVLDLKSHAHADLCLDMIGKADALIEGNRPGVMERLGLGPEQALARNERLVYGRMTGWGQSGPLAQAAGHDINYIAITGALHAIGRGDSPPPPPLNLIGDLGGGALYLAMGICAALFEVRRSGLGQVIDCAMSDGVASLMAMFYGMKANNYWTGERGANLIDGGAHFYRCYACKDGGWIALGSVEPLFYRELLQRAGLADVPGIERQMDRAAWPGLSEKLEQAFLTRTRDEWCAILEGTDACFSPVLSMWEAPAYPHNAARETFVEISGVVQPNVAPRFSRTPSKIQGPPPERGAHGREVLEEWGLDPSRLENETAVAAAGAGA